MGFKYFGIRCLWLQRSHWYRHRLIPPASYGVAQALVPPEDIPNAVDFISSGQSVGVVVFLAIASTVYNSEAIKAVTPILPGVASSEVEAAIAGTSSLIFTTLDAATSAKWWILLSRPWTRRMWLSSLVER